MNKTKTALITGATGGIGEELCREFARNGHDLVITARNKKKLGEVSARLKRAYQIKVTELVADLNQPDSIKKLFEELRDSGITVDFLVNNAGFGMGGYFFHNKLKTQEAMIRVNIMSITRMCRMFIPDMLNRGGGKILNVASTGAFMAGPYNAVYCATKAYVLSLGEAVACELAGSGVTVSTLCPGATRTAFAHRAEMETTRLFNYGVMRPKDVAKAAYNGMMRGDRIIVPGLLNKTLLLLIKASPRSCAARMSGFIQRQFTC